MCGANWIDARRPSCIWPGKATFRCRGSSADVVVITGIGDGSWDEVSEDGEGLIERPAARGLPFGAIGKRKRTPGGLQGYRDLLSTESQTRCRYPATSLGLTDRYFLMLHSLEGWRKLYLTLLSASGESGGDA